MFFFRGFEFEPNYPETLGRVIIIRAPIQSIPDPLDFSVSP